MLFLWRVRIPPLHFIWVGKKKLTCVSALLPVRRRTHTDTHTGGCCLVVLLWLLAVFERSLRWALFHQIRTQQGGADFARSNECFNDSWKFVRGGIKKNENVSSARKSHLGLCSGGDGVNDLCLLLLCDLNRAGALSRLHGTTVLYFTLRYFTFPLSVERPLKK